MSCAICQTRKEKRFCLAIHGRICAQCCGEQREVTLDCPSACPYLQQARQHERPRSVQEIPPDEIFANIELPRHFVHQHEPLIVGVSHAIAQVAYQDRSFTDREVIRGLVRTVKSYQTLVGSGLLYEEATPNVGQQVLRERLEQRFAEYRELEAQHLGYSTLKNSDIMLALVFVLRLAHTHTSGRPRSRAFLDFLHAQFPEGQAAGMAAQEGHGRLVIP